MLTDAATIRDQTLKECNPIHLRLHVMQYPGVWRAWNALAKACVACEGEVCVLVGDDMEPDPVRSAGEIGKEFLERFPDGFGVMQPAGDRQGDIIGGRWNSQRICGSPWVGRAWVTFAYGGKGPVNGDYAAFFADEELKLVAEAGGVLWQRDDLTQKHLHWSWGHLPRQDYHARNQRYWDADRALFETRKAKRFLGALGDR